MPWNPAPIPTISPSAVLGINDTGRTLPIRIRCDTGQSAQDYVVKLWNNVELKTHSLAREIYGTLLANFFNLTTPEIALVDITNDFATYQPNQQIRQYLSNSLGLNFGSLYIPDAKLFSPPVPTSHLSLAARVFCFDMLIGNPDRRYRKINLFQSADGFILFDHEQAFPYSRPGMFVGGHPPAWEFIMETWSKEHVLFSSVRGKPLSFEIEEFIIDVVTLTDEIFATIEAQIPPEWQSDITTISNYLMNARDNADLLKRSLQELLA